MEQFAKLQQRGGIGHALAAQVNAHKAAQTGTVMGGLLARQIGQVEPVLQEMDAQHALWRPMGGRPLPPHSAALSPNRSGPWIRQNSSRRGFANSNPLS